MKEQDDNLKNAFDVLEAQNTKLRSAIAKAIAEETPLRDVATLIQAAMRLEDAVTVIRKALNNNFYTEDEFQHWLQEHQSRPIM